MMLFDSPIDFLIFARIFERAIIVAAVVLCALLFMRMLRQEAQQIDVDLDTKAGAAKASATVAMPVFLLLVLVVFAYVAFSNPVTISHRMDTPVVQEVDKSTNATSEIQVVGYDGPRSEDLQVISAINSMLGSLGEIRQATDGGFNAATSAELDVVWIEVDAAIKQMQFTGLRLLRHRDVLIEQNYGADVVSDCRDEQVKTSVDQTLELSENCDEIIGLLFGAAE